MSDSKFYGGTWIFQIYEPEAVQYFSLTSPLPPIPSVNQPTMATKHPRITIFLQRARQFFLALGCIYAVLLALGMTPFMQRQ